MIKLRSAIAGLPVYTAGKPAPVTDREPSFKLSSNEILSDVDIDWCPPQDRAGLAAAIFSTPRGEVRI